MQGRCMGCTVVWVYVDPKPLRGCVPATAFLPASFDARGGEALHSRCFQGPPLDQCLNAIAVDGFQKLFQGLVHMRDIFLHGIFFTAPVTTQKSLVAGARRGQGGAAVAAGDGGFSGAGRRKMVPHGGIDGLERGARELCASSSAKWFCGMWS